MAIKQTYFSNKLQSANIKAKTPLMRDDKSYHDGRKAAKYSPTNGLTQTSQA